MGNEQSSEVSGDKPAQPDGATSATVLVLGAIPTPELIGETGMNLPLPNGLDPKSNFLPPFGPPDDDPQPEKVPQSFRLTALGGLDEQIQELKRSIILPMMRPDVFNEWSVLPPKGILLHGPPGTGKTFLAKSIVNELRSAMNRNVSFFYRKGGDVFSMWFGESEKKLRAVFAAAKAAAPSVIFFDELDGLCPTRENLKNHGTSAYSSVVTCFLGEMDGLANGRVIVIGATNRLEAVDPAVRRPGRFDKHLQFGFPDQQGRQKIIEINTGKWDKEDRPSKQTMDLLSRQTIGYSGADLEKLCNDVVYVAIEENGGKVSDSMRISPHHWTMAMDSMQKTSSSNFGSFLMSPTTPSVVISTLISPMVETSMKKILALFGPNSSTSASINKSILLHISPNQSRSFLNNQIIQGILSQKFFNGMNMFDLSIDTISAKIVKGSPNILSVVYQVIHQALNSDRPAVVFIPNINEVMALGKANKMAPLMVSALKKLYGPRVLILATSTVPPGELDDGIKTLFIGGRRTVQIENPQQEELTPMFTELLQGRRGMGQIAAQAAKECHLDNFEDVLNLYNALEEAVKDNPENLAGTLREIITLYSQTKLR